MRRFLACLLVAAAVLPACGKDTKQTVNNAPSTTYGPSKPTVTVPSGPPPTTLKIRDIEVGTGPAAKAGDQLIMHYVGVSWSTKKEFDSSYGKQPLAPFALGSGRVIAGWDQGIVGMKVGGRRELIIPPDLAYGADGKGPIGPNETLIFVVDLIRIGAA